MNNAANAMPVIKMSGMSGSVRQILLSAGQLKTTTDATLRQSVRRVRQIFYCLTHARARGTLKTISTNVKISLGVKNLPDSPDKVKEVTVFVSFLLSGTRFILPDMPDMPDRGEI